LAVERGEHGDAQRTGDLAVLENAAVNHVAFNLKINRRPVKQGLQELAEYVLPTFPSVATGARSQLLPVKFKRSAVTGE
jgi:hypothetical protein